MKKTAMQELVTGLRRAKATVRNGDANEKWKQGYLDAILAVEESIKEKYQEMEKQLAIEMVSDIGTSILYEAKPEDRKFYDLVAEKHYKRTFNI